MRPMMKYQRISHVEAWQWDGSDRVFDAFRKAGLQPQGIGDYLWLDAVRQGLLLGQWLVKDGGGYSVYSIVSDSQFRAECCPAFGVQS